MLRQSYDNYIQKEHNKLYQAVTLGSSIFFQQTRASVGLMVALPVKNMMNFLFRLRFSNNFVLIYIGYNLVISSFFMSLFWAKMSIRQKMQRNKVRFKLKFSTKNLGSSAL